MKKNLQLLILITFLYLLSQTASAQVNYFSKTYGISTHNESGSVVKELPNGGYLILGLSSDKTNTNSRRLELIKIKPNGESIYQKTIKTNVDYSPTYSLTINDDGTYTAECQKGLNWLKITTDSLGKVTSENIYKLNLDTFLNTNFITVNVRKHPENGYFIFGINQQMNYLIRTDHNLKNLWAKNLFPDDTLLSFVEDIIFHNNKYVIAAMARGDSSNSNRGLILQTLDNNGELIVKNHFSGKIIGTNKIIPTTDGNFLAAGNSFYDHRKTGPDTPNSDVLITKFTPSLDTVWSKLYYHESDTSLTIKFEDRPGDIEATSDGGAVFYSFISMGNNSSKYRRFLVRIDKDGNKLWESDLFKIDSVTMAPYFHLYQDLIVTSDGGFGLIASKKVNESNDYYFLKTNTYGLMSGIAENKIINNNLFTIYPNPSSGDVTMQFTENVTISKEITLYDITGREVRKYSNIKGNSFILQRESLQKGLYLLLVNDAAGSNIKQAKLLFE